MLTVDNDSPQVLRWVRNVGLALMSAGRHPACNALTGEVHMARPGCMGIRAGRVGLGRVATDLSVATHVVLDFKHQEYDLRWSLNRLFYFGDGMACITKSKAIQKRNLQAKYM